MTEKKQPRVRPPDRADFPGALVAARLFGRDDLRDRPADHDRGGRWAASSYNSQPWRFLYARRGTPSWDLFLSLLVPFNQSWAKNASALLVLVSAETMRPPGAEKDVPSHSHSLDTGAAAANFALQATFMGWQVHGMVGFDIARGVRRAERAGGLPGRGGLCGRSAGRQGHAAGSAAGARAAEPAPPACRDRDGGRLPG
ncbi:MAG: nitroreductase family protein [Acetobacteraceae bacterium]